MDAICSAIAYAEFKRKMGMADVVAARAGDTNERIDFVLKKFGFPAPDFLSDLTPKVADLMDTAAISVPYDSSVYQAIKLIRDSNLRALPVADAENRCVGILSGWKVTRYLFPPTDEALNLGLLNAAISNIVNSFSGEYLVGEPDSSQRRLDIVVGAMSLESLAPRLKRNDPAEVVLFVGDREDIQLAAIDAGVLAIVITGGIGASAKVRAAALEAGTLLISSRFDTTTSAMLSRGAVRVEQMIEPLVTSFWPEMPLHTARQLPLTPLTLYSRFWTKASDSSESSRKAGFFVRCHGSSFWLITMNFLRRSKGQRSFLSSRCSITTGSASAPISQYFSGTVRSARRAPWWPFRTNSRG